MRLQAAAFIVVVVLAQQATAQEARNAAFIELGGSAVVPSLNYERRMNQRWAGRIGLSVVDGESANGTARTFIIPLTASSISRPSAHHHLELGGGVLIAAGDRQDLFDTREDDENFSTLFLTGIVGYRYQKPQGGFQFRAAFTPVGGAGEVVPWAGVSFGYAW